MKILTLNKVMVWLFLTLSFISVAQAQEITAPSRGNMLGTGLSKKSVLPIITNMDYSSDSLTQYYRYVKGEYDGVQRIYLGGEYIEFGIGEDMNSTAVQSDPIPSDYGFWGRRNSFVEGVSLIKNPYEVTAGAFLSDNDGFGRGKDLRIDYFLPLEVDEHWELDIKDGFIFDEKHFDNNHIENFGVRNNKNLFVKGKSIADDGSISVNHDISYSYDERYIKYKVDITCLKDEILPYDMTYVREIHVDNDIDLGGIPKGFVQLSGNNFDESKTQYFKVSASSENDQPEPSIYHTLTNDESVIYIYTEDIDKVELFSHNYHLYKGSVINPNTEIFSGEYEIQPEIGIKFYNTQTLNVGDTFSFTYYLGLSGNNAYVTAGENIPYYFHASEFNVFDPGYDVSLITIESLPNEGKLWVKSEDPNVGDTEAVIGQTYKPENLFYLVKTKPNTNVSFEYSAKRDGTPNQKTMHIGVVDGIGVIGDLISKTYDGNTDVDNPDDLNLVLDGTYPDVSLVIPPTTEYFYDHKNADTDKDGNNITNEERIIYIVGPYLKGDKAGEYVLPDTLKIASNILPRGLDIDVAALDRVYDSTKDVVLVNDKFSVGDNVSEYPPKIVDKDKDETINRIPGDDVTLINYSGEFKDENAGDDKDVVLNSEINLTGNDKNNYYIISEELTADIRKREVYVDTDTLKATDKVYDASLIDSLVFVGLHKDSIPHFGQAIIDAESNDTTGFIVNDSIRLDDYILGQFDTVDVDYLNDGVTIDTIGVTSYITLVGADVNNYKLVQPDLFAKITPKRLMIAKDDQTTEIDSLTKLYDSNSLINVKVDLLGVLNNEVKIPDSIEGTFKDSDDQNTAKDVEDQNKTNNNKYFVHFNKLTSLLEDATSEPKVGNYYIKKPTVVGEITVRPVYVDALVLPRVYVANDNSATLVNSEYNDGDELSSYLPKFVAVTDTSGVVVEDSVANTATIIQPTNPHFVNYAIADSVSVDATFGIDGIDKDNYQLMPPVLFAEVLERYPLNYDYKIIADGKVYDGDKNTFKSQVDAIKKALIDSLISSSTKVGYTDVRFNFENATFEYKTEDVVYESNTVSYNTIIVKGFVLEGDDAKYFEIGTEIKVRSIIRPRHVTATASVKSKEYNKDDLAVILNEELVYSVGKDTMGVIAGDTLALSFTAADVKFTQVGVGKNISVTHDMTIVDDVNNFDNELDYMNYIFDNPSLTGEIYKRTIDPKKDDDGFLDINAFSKVYDSDYYITPDTTLTGVTLTNILNNDIVEVEVDTAYFVMDDRGIDPEHVADSIQIYYSLAFLPGSDTVNYQLPKKDERPLVYGAIAKRDLNVSASVRNKPEDGNSIAEILDAKFTDLITNDNVALINHKQGNFVDENGKEISVPGIYGVKHNIDIAGIANHQDAIDTLNYNLVVDTLSGKIQERYIISLKDLTTTDKVYDATDNVLQRQINAIKASAELGGLRTDSSTVSLIWDDVTFNYVDENVKYDNNDNITNNLIIISGLKIEGDDAKYYDLELTDTIKSTIIRRKLTAYAVAQEKSYDGDTLADILVTGILDVDNPANGEGLEQAENNPDLTRGYIEGDTLTLDGFTNGYFAQSDVLYNDQDEVVEIEVTSADPHTDPITEATMTVVGKDYKNYEFEQPKMEAKINPRVIEIEDKGNGVYFDHYVKIYDSDPYITPDTTLTGAIVSNVVGSDVVGIVVDSAIFVGDGVFDPEHVRDSILIYYEISFAPGSDEKNYKLPEQDNLPDVYGTIDRRKLTVSASVEDRPENGTSTAKILDAKFIDLIKDDNIELVNHTEGDFVDENGTPVSVPGEYDVKDYMEYIAIEGHEDLIDTMNYNIIVTPLSGIIRDITSLADFMVDDKIYDATPDVLQRQIDQIKSGVSLVLIPGYTDVTLDWSEVTFSYVDKNVKYNDSDDITHNQIVISGLKYEGEDAKYYELEPTDTVNSTIIPRKLTAYAIAQEKYYDGDTLADILVTGILDVNNPGYGEGLEQAENNPDLTRGYIEGDTLTLDGFTSGYFAQSDVLYNDQDEVVEIEVTSADPHTDPITEATMTVIGKDYKNYEFEQPEMKAKINPRVIEIEDKGNGVYFDHYVKIYDSDRYITPDTTLTGAIVSNVVGNDVVGIVVDSAIFVGDGVIDPEHVRDSILIYYEISFSSGSDEKNYKLPEQDKLPDVYGSIVKRDLNISASVEDRPENGTSTARILDAKFVDLINNDNIQLVNHTEGDFVDENGMPVSDPGEYNVKDYMEFIAIEGHEDPIDTMNYNIIVTPLSGIIRDITSLADFVVDDKIYDGTEDVLQRQIDQIKSGVYLELIDEHPNVTLDWSDVTFSYVDKNVKYNDSDDITYNKIVISGLKHVGEDAKYYDLEPTDTVNSVISPRKLTAFAIAQDKPYDGDTLADILVTGILDANNPGNGEGLEKAENNINPDRGYIKDDKLILDGFINGYFAQSDVLYDDRDQVDSIVVTSSNPHTGAEATMTVVGKDYKNYEFEQPIMKAKINPIPVVITITDLNPEWEEKTIQRATVTVDIPESDIVTKYYQNGVEVNPKADPEDPNAGPMDIGEYDVVVTVTNRNYIGGETAVLTIEDRTPPVITLIGEEVVEVDYDMPYKDDGATAYDNYDKDITPEIDTLNGWSKGLLPGDYTYEYRVVDSNGNEAEPVQRTIRVVWGDKDKDGIPDNEEDLDGDGDPTNDDTDGDGIPNYNDPDDDDDGIPTKEETQHDDSDHDGIPNYLDPDDDDDGILTREELPHGDTDSDGKPNYLDIDDDGDGVYSRIEMGNVYYGDDNDRIPDGPDADGDGIVDYQNTDGDAFVDYLDVDDDNDSVLTRTELGDVEFYDADDEEGYYEGLAKVDDINGDGIPDFRNTDSDDYADYLDVDDDGDMVLTIVERTNSDGTISDIDTDGCKTYDYLDKDDDEDGVRSIDELGIDKDLIVELPREEHFNLKGDVVFYHPSLDANNDGAITLDELANFDNDEALDYLDNDDDNDGVLTSRELGQDTDGDGIEDMFDLDDDGDTVPTIEEFALDTDQDGIQNHLEVDDDNDNILTIVEKDLNVDCDIDSLDHLDPTITPPSWMINAPEMACKTEETLLELWGELGRAKYVQWKFEGEEISGATQLTYNIVNTQHDHEGTYSVEITDYCGNVYEVFRYVMVSSADDIVTMWDDVIAVDNSKDKYVAYQWYVDGEIIKGATSQYFNKPEGLEGWYSVELTFTGGEVRMSCPVYVGANKKSNVYDMVSYPNPANHYADTYLRILKNGNLYEESSIIRVFDTKGLQVLEVNSNDVDDTGSIIMHTKLLRSGVYIIRAVLDNDEVITNKMVIE